MTDLRTAAQQALEQLKINRTNFRKGPSKSICKMLAGGNDEVIRDLEAALAEPEPCQYPDCVDNGPDGKCIRWLLDECSKSEDYKPQRTAEPQEPDSPERRCGGPGCDMRCCQPVQEPQGCDHCEHPLYAATKCRVCGRVTEPTPPQRMPLAEWQINDLMADIDPEDRDSWSFRQGVYAAEKHHGVRK